MSLDTIIEQGGIRIVPTKVSIPEINPKAYGDEFFTDAIQCLLDWLAMPFVYDAFGSDHEARRRWRAKLIQKNAENGKNYYQSIRKNKLRKNYVFALECAVLVLKKYSLYQGMDKDLSDLEQSMKALNYEDCAIRGEQLEALEKQVVSMLEKMADHLGTVSPD